MSRELFRPHEACRSYASAAAVLAGFCFAAVVLTVTVELGTTTQARLEAGVEASEASTLTGAARQNEISEAADHAQEVAEDAQESRGLDRPAGALLSAFVGLVMSSFLFARIGGRSAIETPDPGDASARVGTRICWLVLIGSCGLATSALFALWGAAGLIDVALGHYEELTTLVWLVFLATSVTAAAFVIAAASDLRAVASGTKPSSAETRASHSTTELMWHEQFSAERMRAHEKRIREWRTRVRMALNGSSADSSEVPGPGTKSVDVESEDAGHVAASPEGGRLVAAGPAGDRSPDPAGLEVDDETRDRRLSDERGWLLAAAVLGGSLLFAIGIVPLGVPDATTTIERIAIIQLVGFSALLIMAVGLSCSTDSDAPKWLRGLRGAVLGYFLVAATPAVALALLLRLPVSG